MNRTIVNGRDDQYISYIVNNNTGTKIKFPVMPNGISENVTANFTQQDIVGASRPRIVYSSTSANTIGFSLQNLTEDYVVSGFNSLNEYVRTLQALVYPSYPGSGIVKSPDLTLVLGSKAIQCVCTSVNVSWGNTVKEQNITTCNVDMSFIRTRDNVPGATDIELRG